MIVDSYGDSIIFGKDASGKLRHIDEVANGAGCGCFCPSPKCHQPLIAKNGGSIRAHHFAHKTGSCSWAIDNVVTELVYEFLTENRKMMFPELNYFDHMSKEHRLIAGSSIMQIGNIEYTNIAKRGAPDLMVEVKANDQTRVFAFTINLIHRLSNEQRELLKSISSGVIQADLNALLQAMRAKAGKHHDRIALLARFQDKGFLADMLTGKDNARFIKWATNDKRDIAEHESKRKREEWQKEQDRIAVEKSIQREREQQESKRRRQQERKQRLVAEKTRKHEEQVNAERKRQEAEEREREYVTPMIDQQEKPVRDSQGRRWYRCTNCKEIGPFDDFVSTSGRNRGMNEGVCRKCYP